MSIVPRDPHEPITAAMRWTLFERWQDGERLMWSFRLALNLETCADLIAGRPVSPGRLDQDELSRAHEPQLVQLVAPVDLLTGAP